MSGNQLKIIAAIAMTVDHIGACLFPEILVFRIIGRIAFPIFAYMIAVGCRYTKNRPRYLIRMAILALLCQVVYFAVQHSLYQCVLVTFSFSIAIIFALDKIQHGKKYIALSVLLVALVFFVSGVLPMIIPGFDIDYGFCGIMLPVFAYMGIKSGNPLAFFTASLAALCAYYGGIQWFAMISSLLLMLYNGKRGKLKMKNFFYIYYPLHMAIIGIISLIGR